MIIKKIITVIIIRDNCLADIQSDGPLLADTHFGAFCQKTLWFGEIRPQDTADRLQPVEETFLPLPLSSSSMPLPWPRVQSSELAGGNALRLLGLPLA